MDNQLFSFLKALGWKSFYHWYAPWGIFAALSLALLAWNALIKLLDGHLELDFLPLSTDAVLLIALLLIFLLFWLYSYALPRNILKKSKTIYVLVAIKCRSSEQYELIKRELIDRLEGRLTDFNKPERFHFKIVVLNSYRCSKLKSFNQAKDLLHKIDGDLLIWGYFSSDSKKALIHIDSYVRHEKIPIYVSNVFARQASLLAPEEEIVSVENLLPHLRETSKKLNLCATFMVGKAALLSGSWRISIHFIDQLLKELFHVSGDKIGIIKEVLREDLCFAYFKLAEQKYEKFKKTRDLVFLREGLVFLEKARKLKVFLDVLSLLAIYNYFFGNIDEAGGLIRQAIRINKKINTFYWCQAFLLAAKGDFKRAAKEYWSCFKKDIPESSFKEIVEFIFDECENGKKEFNFILGLIFRHKKEKEKALKCFREFIGEEKFEIRFPWAYKRANDFIIKLEK